METLQQKIQSAHTLEEKITLIDKIIKDKAEITERYSRSVVETNQNSMAAIVVAAKKEEDNFLNSFNAEK